MNKKLNIGIFSFTGDEGCVIVFTEILNDYIGTWKDLVEFKFARVLQKKNTIKGIDVAFVEGAMSSPKEIKRLKQVRKTHWIAVSLISSTSTRPNCPNAMWIMTSCPRRSSRWRQRRMELSVLTTKSMH